MKWRGQIFPNGTLLSLFEKLKSIFHTSFEAFRAYHLDSIELISRLLKSTLDITMPDDLIAGQGLVSGTENAEVQEMREE